MNKIAFIYPGQGAQVVGMGADFYENSPLAKALYDEACELLGLDIRRICFEENDELDLTEYTQAAMVTTCLAMTREIEALGIHPDMTAGLSLGEYAAIAVAGAMDELDAIRAVRQRGILMQNTVPSGVGAMAAVLGMSGEQIENVTDTMADVSIANYNCPGQIVITGKADTVEEACKKLKEAGAKRTVMLNVSGPFHSPMLKDAGKKLAEFLEQMELKPLKIPYVTNVTAQKVEDSGEIRELLAKQVSSSVRWQQSMEQMIADGVDTFVEIGPGRTLSGFMKKINRDVKMYRIEKWEDIETVKEILTC